MSSFVHEQICHQRKIPISKSRPHHRLHKRPDQMADSNHRTEEDPHKSRGRPLLGKNTIKVPVTITAPR